MAVRDDGRPPTTRGPKALSDILNDLFAVRGLGRLQARADLEAAWSEAVGEAGRGQTRVEALRNGVLSVVVAHPTLLEELRSYQKSNLLQALRRSLPDVVLHDLRFRIGSLTTQASSENPNTSPGSAAAAPGNGTGRSAPKSRRKPTSRD